ncbi:hypothetical protein AK812_SmicGene29384 [Symbiodinium microadriaticum]|uniref:Uncharacterized protein n=1 Tax=Symbiodinium microadriaticum TaxID=2951 RepID=A0A1Q9D1X2_SYMMI|nr:hypothetical protein AK812_SmicGene29384 [Symbiodinium microadriaticum]
MIDPECVSPWQLPPSPAAGRGSFHALTLLLLVLCLPRRRALLRNVPKGCCWRRMQGPVLTPKKVHLEVDPQVVPKRASLAGIPKVRLGLQVCNKFEVLSSPVATPTPSPRAAQPAEHSLPEVRSMQKSPRWPFNAASTAYLFGIMDTQPLQSDPGILASPVLILVALMVLG